MTNHIPEHQRLDEARRGVQPWKKWGPYLSERQWGTVGEDRKRGRTQPEFELLDTGIFDDDRYFDVFVEYAKAGPDDVLMRVTVHNRGPDTATLHVLPQLWFRNTWSWKGIAKPGRLAL